MVFISFMYWKNNKKQATILRGPSKGLANMRVDFYPIFRKGNRRCKQSLFQQSQAGETHCRYIPPHSHQKGNELQRQLQLPTP